MSSEAPQQLPLALRLDDGASLENFHCSPANAQLLAYLCDFVLAAPADSPMAGTTLNHFLWLCGPTGAGKSHLIQALCLLSERHGHSVCHVPLAARAGLTPQQALQPTDAALTVLDDVDDIVGNADWERALFRLYNELASSPRHRLLVASALTPQQLASKAGQQGGLADLYSRWQSAVVMPLQPLSDEDKRAALQLRARGLGLVLSNEVLHFLLSRSGRGMHSLLALLDALDQHSMATRRRITVPLIKSLTGW